MMKIVVGLLGLAVSITVIGSAAKCKCQSTNESTRDGANEWVVYQEPVIHKRVEGVVVEPAGVPQQDALVEIFDQPDYLMCEWRANNPNGCSPNPPANQRRLGVCKTAKDGKFCFDNIPTGKYELRISKDRSWTITHVYLVIDPNDSNSSKSRINVSMRPGT